MAEESISNISEEQMQDMITRAVAQQSAALTLLDGAMALRNGEITPETFTQLTEECIKWGDAIGTMGLEDLKKFCLKQIEITGALCPHPKKGPTEEEVREAVSKIQTNPVTLPEELKRKMN